MLTILFTIIALNYVNTSTVLTIFFLAILVTTVDDIYGKNPYSWKELFLIGGIMISIVVLLNPPFLHGEYGISEH